jgi:hypothetical protein
VQQESETKYCLQQAIRTGNCSDQDHTCHDEFMAIGSWTMAKNCDCQQLQENKRRCTCCINCGTKEAKILSKILHLNKIDDTNDKCSNL